MCQLAELCWSADLLGDFGKGAAAASEIASGRT